MAAFFMFLCLGEVIGYLFYNKRPTEYIIDGSTSTIIPQNEQKEEPEKRLQYSYFPINFAKFLRTLFKEQLRCLLLKMNTTKPNYYTQLTD